MEPTGFDTVIFTFVRPRHVFRQALAAIVARWPGSLVDDLDDSEAAPWPACSSAGDDSLPSEAGVLLFLRDDMMAWHLREYGYTPMPDGDGPFALWSRRMPALELPWTPAQYVPPDRRFKSQPACTNALSRSERRQSACLASRCVQLG